MIAQGWAAVESANQAALLRGLLFARVQTNMLCDALHDLDVRFRAVVSIFNDWREETKEQNRVDESQPVDSPSSVQRVWNFGDICKLLIQALEGSQRIVDICKSTSPKKFVDEGESGQARALLQEYVKITERFRGALSDFISLLNRLTSQDANSAVAPVQRILDEMTERSKCVEQFLELLEWEELDRQALPPSEFKQLAAYLLETGKASA